MRKNPCLVALAVVAVLLTGQGYGYTKEQDPLLKSFKEAIRGARAGDWPAVERVVAEVEWQVTELRDDFGIDLGPKLAEAAGKKSVQATANAFANLVLLALLQKLHWNLRERLDKLVPARARMTSAEAYYDEVLSGNVRAGDKKGGSDRHGALSEQLARLRKAIGSPGLFGIGGRDPEPDAFRDASDKVLALVREAFPYLVTPESLGASEPVGPHDSDAEKKR